MDGMETVPPMPGREAPGTPRTAPPSRWLKGARSCGFWVLLAMTLAFGATSLLLLVALVGLGSARHAPGRLAQFGFKEQHVAGNPHGRTKLLVVSINGIIVDEPLGGLPARLGLVSAARLMLRAAAKDERVRAVLLEIDSPGGGITASDVLHNEVLRFREESGKPVIALLNDLGASGAYYVAAAADRIIAHPTTLTGSIGVMMPWFGVRALLDKIGIEARPVKSGELKDIAAMYRDPLPEERRLLRDIVNEYHQRFISVVHDGFKRRGARIDRKELEALCDGRLWTGEQARNLGFVDEIGYFDDAIGVVAERLGVPADEINVVAYVPPRPSLLGLLFGLAGPGQPKTLKLNLGGVGERECARFMYLWTIQPVPSLSLRAE